MKINIPKFNLGNDIVPEECRNGKCVDIGANVGDFSLKYASFFQEIHYYEPYLECWKIADANLRNFSNCIGWNEAAFDSDGIEVSMVSHINAHAGSNAVYSNNLNSDWNVESIQKIKTVSLKTIFRRIGGKINYLKMDCETSEYPILINQDLSNIDYIGIELHWQIGELKYNELLSHINKTHETTNDCRWEIELNKEVLFKKK